MTRQVFGVQAQPPAAAADSFPDPGELNTDNCFCTALLSHLGQLICSRDESTIGRDDNGDSCIQISA
jgi:hypothetical protein